VVIRPDRPSAQAFPQRQSPKLASTTHAVTLDAAPTRFGRLTVVLDRPAPQRLRASWTAVPVLVRVRIPDGARGVKTLTPGTRLVGERWIECPPGASEVLFTIQPTREPER